MLAKKFKTEKSNAEKTEGNILLGRHSSTSKRVELFVKSSPFLLMVMKCGLLFAYASFLCREWCVMSSAFSTLLSKLCHVPWLFHRTRWFCWDSLVAAYIFQNSQLNAPFPTLSLPTRPLRCCRVFSPQFNYFKNKAITLEKNPNLVDFYWSSLVINQTYEVS